MEELKKKKDFRSARVKRWVFRLEKSQFDVKDGEGRTLVVSDALSRASVEKDAKVNEEKPIEEMAKKDKNLHDKVIKIHEKLNHRRSIAEYLQKMDLNIKKKSLVRILDSCMVCKIKDKQYIKASSYVEVDRQEKRIGADISEIDSNNRIIMAIDIFTRKVFAKVVKTKEGHKILKFIKELHEQFPFTSITTGNGKEFENMDIEKWMKKKGNNHIYALPYYHKE